MPSSHSWGAGLGQSRLWPQGWGWDGPGGWSRALSGHTQFLSSPYPYDAFVTQKQWIVKVAEFCLTLCDPLDYTVHGILQARTLEWVAIPFFRGSSQPTDWTQDSHITGRFFTSWATREAQAVGYPDNWNPLRASVLSAGLFAHIPFLAASRQTSTSTSQLGRGLAFHPRSPGPMDVASKPPGVLPGPQKSAPVEMPSYTHTPTTQACPPHPPAWPLWPVYQWERTWDGTRETEPSPTTEN